MMIPLPVGLNSTCPFRVRDSIQLHIAAHNTMSKRLKVDKSSGSSSEGREPASALANDADEEQLKRGGTFRFSSESETMVAGEITAGVVLDTNTMVAGEITKQAKNNMTMVAGEITNQTKNNMTMVAGEITLGLAKDKDWKPSEWVHADRIGRNRWQIPPPDVGAYVWCPMADGWMTPLDEWRC